MNPLHTLPLLALCLFTGAPRAANTCGGLAPTPACSTQDPQTIAAAIAAIRAAPDLIEQGIDWAKGLNRLFKGGMHPLWYVRYKDGTVVYNKFRFYRSPKVILEYFTGKSPSPDSDAYMVRNGRRVHIRYDRNGARDMVRRHGKIVHLGCLN